MNRTVSIIALPSSTASAVMGVVDILNTANRIAARVNSNAEPLFLPRIISVDGLPVQSSSGYRLNVDGSLQDVGAADLLYIAPLAIADRNDLYEALESWQSMIPWFSEHVPQQPLVATNCSGSFLLAEAGVLNHEAATTAWWLADCFAERYPQIRLERDAICTRSGNILTGAGTTAFQDVCLALLEQFAGKHFARLAAKYLMVDNQRRSQAPYAILSLVTSDDAVVNRAEAWVRTHMSRDFKIEELAAAMGVSPRTLIRRFQNALGETPQGFAQRLRIEKSKVLLETTQLGFPDIVQRCGYHDESAFRRLFKRHCQLSPREYRRRFNTATPG